MPKSLKIYLFILVLIFIAILAIDANKAKPIDWRPTYATKDKIPCSSQDAEQIILSLKIEILEILKLKVIRFKNVKIKDYKV